MGEGREGRKEVEGEGKGKEEGGGRRRMVERWVMSRGERGEDRDQLGEKSTQRKERNGEG